MARTYSSRQAQAVTSHSQRQPLSLSARVARALWALVVLLCALALLFLSLNRRTLASLEDAAGPLGGYVFAVGSATVGALILGRHPRHLVGWLFSGLAVPVALYGAAAEYAVYGLVVARAPLPGLPLAAWVQSWALYVTFPATLALLYLLFPDGRPPSRGWWPVAGLGVVSAALAVSGAMFLPGPVVVFRTVQEVPLPLVNPWGRPEHIRLFETLANLGWTGGVISLLASLVALGARYRQTSGRQRQQIKWLVYCSLAVLTGLLASLLLQDVVGPLLDGVLFPALISSLPVAVGIGILRYQLYDIDRLIKRTLVYSVLTGLLTAVYLGSIGLLQAVFPAGSEAAIVLSTLLAAALFQPLRGRVQAAIDRRFYRRKYDAQQTLAAFGETMRHTVALEPLTESLLAAVHETVQPAWAGVWLREGAGRRAAGAAERH